MEEQASYSTVNYSTAYREAFKTFCKQNGLKQIEYMEKSLRFFQRTGINPADEKAVEELSTKNTNRLIGFLKVQDKIANQHFEMTSQRIEVLEKQLAQQTDLISHMIRILSDV